MIGIAYQAGLLPMAAESIEAAIRLNGVAVEKNLQAFRYGRLFQADPARVTRLLGEPVLSADEVRERQLAILGADAAAYAEMHERCRDMGEESRRLLGLRIAELIRYQDAAYARKYVDAVVAVWEKERALGTGSEALTQAAARYLHKLMAYKDEYEVARLLLKGEWAERVRATFVEPKVKFNLHPPLLRERGLKNKLELGAGFRPVLALVGVYFFWGSTFLGIRYAIDTLPPFLMAGFRFILAGLVLLAITWLRGGPGSWRGWAAATGTGVVMLVAGNGAVVWAEQSVPSGLVALTVSTSPIWMVLADRIFFGARLRWPAMLGIAIGLLGIAVLVNPGTAVIPLLPTLVLVLSSVGWATGTLLSRTRAMPKSTFLMNSLQMLGGGAAFLLIATLVGDPGRLDVHRVSGASLAGLAWLIVFGSLIGFTCYLWLIRVAPIPLVSTQAYVSPLVAVVLGALLRHESLSARALVAGGVILAGVVMVASAPLLTSRRPAEELQAA